MAVELVLPFPPSVNHYWRMHRGRMLISREGRAYRRTVCSILSESGLQPFEGSLFVQVDVYPPDRRRRDLDNLQKGLLDSIQHAGIYHDDSQIDQLMIRRCQRIQGGQVVVHITTLPLHRCPTCHQLIKGKQSIEK